MKKHIPSNLRIKALSMAIAAASCCAAPLAFSETLSLEEVVVTGSPSGKQSKMDNSVSVTTVSQERIDNFVARTTTEIFRSIPGVRSESSAGESNTNLSIRGIPVASGGGKFLQLHEDGLPVLQFGDVIVGNADNFISYDYTVKRIEAVKGGTAATLASNSPGGIINFVSKTGEEEGGSIGITAGLDYDSQRIDFEYGTPIGDDWAAHVGGYYRDGEGVRETGFNGNQGGQLKLSLKRNFDNGHVRVYAKVLDDKTSTYLPMPMKAGGSSITGFDAGTGSNMPRELLTNRTGNGGTGIRNSSIGDGSTVKSNVIGAEFVLDLDESLSVSNKMRLAQNSGKFFGAFTASLGAASDLGAISNALPGTVDGFAYASGANSGSANILSAAELANLNGNGLVQNIRSFDNDINSLDNFTNDLRLTKSFERFDVTAGYYTASQDVDVDWYWQTYIADVSDNVRLLDAYAGATQLTTGGVAAFGAPDWGYCCYRQTTLETNIDAVYLAVSGELSDALTFSASVRYDEGEGNGNYSGGENASIDFDSDGLISLAESQAQLVTQAEIAISGYQYDWDYVSYAFGLNYLLTDETAIFANINEGGRANADRLGDGGFISEGSVTKGAIENTVSQYEFGVKHENENFGVFATAFYVETEDANSEGTNGSTNTAILREYEALGLEVELVANLGDISLFGGFTWTDAEITKSNTTSLEGNTPRRQADFVYSGTAVYTFGEHRAGLAMVGTTDAYSQDANGYTMDGYTYFNAFVNYQLADGFTATLAINNLTDEIGVTEVEEDSPAVINGSEYVRARSIAGRSTSLTLKYEF